MIKGESTYMNQSSMKKNANTKKRISIRTKWILFICASVFVALAVTVLFTHITISKILEKDNISTNKSNSKNAAEQIHLELKKYETSLEQLSSLVANQVQRGGSLEDIDRSLKAIKDGSDILISVYYMDGKSGKLHIAPYVSFDKDVKDTRTYKQLRDKTETQWMDIYKDEASGKIMTSVVTPVMVDGKMVGALGYDIDLSTIGKARQTIENYSNSNLVILDPHGFIVTSFMKNADGKNMNPAKSGSVDGVNDLLTDSKAFNKQFGWVDGLYDGSKKTSSQNLTWDGKDYTGQISTIPNLNWKVLSFTPKEVFLSKMNHIKMTGLISIVLGLIIGAICAAFLAGKLKKMITSLQIALGKTASGDLVSEFVVTSNDEIGDLSKSYNEMLQNVRELILKVKRNVSSVNETTNGLNVIATENQSAINEVSRSIEEIALGASNQSEQVESGSSSIHDLSGEIEKLIEQSDTLEDVMNETASQVQSGKSQVGNLEESYHKLAVAFEKVTNMISQLNEKSKTISDVTYTISQIAEQTNLLSLNASIEAARAGEHGKGFAVVANEVRTLADDSKKATNNIQQIINSVLTDTKDLVEVMKETNHISFEQKGAVTTMSESMEQMTTSLSKMFDSVQEETISINTIKAQKEIVVTMIEEISAVSEQTTASSQEIASTMEEQAASSNELAQHTQQLSNLIKDLDGAVGEFRVQK